MISKLELIDSFYENLNSKEVEPEIFINCMEKHVLSRDFYTLDELFPENLYPIFDIFIGEDGRKDFLEAIRNIRKTPYDNGLRSENYKLYGKKISVIFSAFVERKLKKLSLIDILKETNSELAIAGLALEIDEGNQKIIDIVEEMILGDNTSFVLSEFVIKEIFRSSNKYLVELLGNLLLGANLQEGLREAISRNINIGTIENFKYMYELIYENNLIRYPSVETSLNTIFDFPKMINENYTINKTDMKIVYNLFKGEQSIEKLINSDDIKKIYFGFWYIALFDINNVVNRFQDFLKIKTNHRLYLVLKFLESINDLSSEIAFKIISENMDDNDINERIHIFVCFLKLLKDELKYKISCETILENYDNHNIVAYIFTNIFYFKDECLNEFLEKDEEDRKDILIHYFGDRGTAKNIFDVLHKFLNEKFDNNLFKIMVIISILYDDREMLYMCLGYMRFAEKEYKVLILNTIFNDPKNEEDYKLILSMLTDVDCCQTASEIIKRNNVCSKYAREIESVFEVKSMSIHRILVDLLYLQSNEELFLSISNLISSKNKSIRLEGLNLIIRSLSEKRFSIERLLDLAKSIKETTIYEEVLLEEIFTENN